MADVPIKYVIPLILLASVPLGIAAYRHLPTFGAVNAAQPAPAPTITLPDNDIKNACYSAYSQLLVLGSTLQTGDCIEHKFIDRNTGVVAFDIVLPEGVKRMQFAVRRRADGKNWDLFDPATGKLWSQALVEFDPSRGNRP
jgi:hypothetical protein